MLITPIGPEESDTSLGIFLIGTLGFWAPQIWRRIGQYGARTYPDKALKLPYPEDPVFERAVNYFQRVDGPKVIYLSGLRKKRAFLDNAHFFSRLRYLLFSRRRNDRGMVMRIPSAIGVYSDLYIHRDNVERMLSTKKPARTGKRGRPVKYPYDEAIAAAMYHPQISKLDLSNDDEAFETIKDFLAEWFRENEDESCTSPRREQLGTPAKKVLAKLKLKRSEKVSVIGQLSPFDWPKRIRKWLQIA